MDSAVTRGRERRAARRRKSVDDHDVISTRIRPGHDAHLLDVSAGGALIETAFRLLPGAAVEIRLATRRLQHIVVRGEVMRCTVVRLRPIIYRGAIRFDREVATFADAGEYALPVPKAVQSTGSREGTTHGLE